MAEDHNPNDPAGQQLHLANMMDAKPRFDSPWGWRALFARKQPIKERVLEHVREAANSVWQGDPSGWPLVLLGEAGSGKTSACLLMLAAWGRGQSFYMTFDSWCDRIRFAKCGELASDSGFSIGEPAAWRDWEWADFAVLDDIGTREKASDHVYEVLKRSLDRREDGLPTVYTSNLKLDEIACLFDDRVASRLSAGTIVYLEGDQRQAEFDAANRPEVEE
jgi:DNA replication protein DnaC